MKIKYEFADGKVSEVEVEDSIGAFIVEDRRLEDNFSRKERYHCYSLDAVQFEGAEYSGGETPETQMERGLDAELTTTKEPEKAGKTGKAAAKNTAKKDTKAAKQEPEEKPLTSTTTAKSMTGMQ